MKLRIRGDSVRVRLKRSEVEQLAAGDSIIAITHFPDAEFKIFLTASENVRAKRRYDELIGKGMKADLEEVRENISRRDHIDSTREDSPLKQASDAIVLDNSNMTVDEQMDWFRDKYKDIIRKIHGKGGH